ncbi:recombination regulator RecX [[Mannheimia] succiniciproducens]|uniref:Regulatory protein RecX n=1 Tax=Mannheimia succiniciproducens (strain KCTC 0769BP / MBEL55E) TaxID=221988 RepID=RECX_MANSM|nr:recombination regulator RecX [[Mannheimia] succiniciproducens]Q65QB1.1 RecName: Full=Regulatory protein RecX [[Mannheimia] succiniciproducens MBEL55E]AAU38849.1 OraA protein [[Mannheimia] succiniciproducens MBEL55E]
MTTLAFSYAVNLLSRREYSEFEIRCKMQEKAFSEQEIEDTLAQLQQKNWQSDKRFTENYLRARAQRGYGVNRIKQELRQLKGILPETVDEALMECDIDWSEIALNVLAKKFPDYRARQDAKNKQKIWRYMLSHGFFAEDFADFIGNGTEDEFY